MKCKNCGSEWHCAGNVVRCPFCRQDCRLSDEEIRALYAAAEEIPEAHAAAKAEAYLRVAEYGHAQAGYAMGLCYENGTGVPKSPCRAAVFFRMAAEKAHPEAACRLAEHLMKLYRGTPDIDRAYFWLRVSAELGSGRGARLLGQCYENGEGIAESPLRAAYWYTRASDEGDFPAAELLAALYHDGRGVRRNPAYEKYYAEVAYNGGVRQAFNRIQKLGDHVFSEVPAPIEIKNRGGERFELGYRAYSEGKYVLAAALYQLAAQDGYARAQNSLGVCYERGEGVDRDEKTAFVWYGLSAAAGYETARLNLGDCYRYGRGTERDEGRAMDAYLTAAKNGLPEAQFLVGECYFNADLVDRDLPTAMQWYEKAALQGYGPALEKVNSLRADMTELYNRGVDAYAAGNYTDAVRYYMVAAAFGHRGAQCNLGTCYENGQGCEKDMKKAVACYRQAAEQESGVAEYNLAVCYLRGAGGLSYDYAAANALLRRAAAHGEKKAEARLSENNERRGKKLARQLGSVAATVLHRGTDHLADALKFRRIAAEMGNPRAMFAMGCHYEFGFGVPQDAATAAAWYRRAAAAGYRGGSRMKSTILKMMRRPDSTWPARAPRPEKAAEKTPDGENPPA